MTFYRIVVAYDGTAYRGWQEQNNATTISGTLIKAFEEVFFQEAKILGASRTDAGVHALSQVAILRTGVNIFPEKMLQAWSKAIPSDITIRSIEKIDSLVHPHDGVIEKTYAYHIFLERPLPFYQRFGWYIYKPLNLEILQKALNVFIGQHDFRSFCTGDDLSDTIRTIDSVKILYVSSWNAYKIEIKGKSFLRYMIRRIVGASVAIATSPKLNVQDLQNVLDEKNPCHTLPNAPAKGLVLEQIVYQKGDLQ
ncbi:tRNA pseudouridine(38-40) synthase TruA [Candidatus Dependentiae bacterium]|nr:tRNA pseudouridine(38-40) synthase TruA [Candidatus Dependentiae bacterium]